MVLRNNHICLIRSQLVKHHFFLLICIQEKAFDYSLQWRHNEQDGVSIKEKNQSFASLAFVGGNSPVTGEFLAQKGQ